MPFPAAGQRRESAMNRFSLSAALSDYWLNPIAVFSHYIRLRTGCSNQGAEQKHCLCFCSSVGKVLSFFPTVSTASRRFCLLWLRHSADCDGSLRREISSGISLSEVRAADPTYCPSFAAPLPHPITPLRLAGSLQDFSCSEAALLLARPHQNPFSVRVLDP